MAPERDGEARLVVFLGAGASVTGEAGLPLFAALREAVFDSIPLVEMCDLDSISTDELSALLGLLAPEALLLLLERTGVPVGDALVALFNGTDARPNAVHLVAATMASAGVPVWTTNYDTLIEEAAAASGLPLLVSVATVDAAPGEANLLKVHGSLATRCDDKSRRDLHGAESPTSDWHPAGPLLYTAPPLVTGLPAPYRNRLACDFAGAHVAVLGYAGADVDLYPALLEAIGHAASVTWFEVDDPARVAALYDRFDSSAAEHSLTRSGAQDSYALSRELPTRFSVEGSDDPARAFIRWAIKARPGLFGPLKEELEARSTQFREPTLCCPSLQVPPEGLYRLAYQLGISHTIRREAAQSVTWALRRRLDGRALGRRVRGHPTVATALTAAASLKAPPVARDWLRRLATQERTSDERHPSTETILRWLSRHWEPHLALAATHALKFDGRLEDAARLASDSLRLALTDPDRIDVVGALSFQLADLLSMQGDYGAARAQARLGYGSVSSVVLATWERLVPSACLVAEGLQLTDVQLEEVRMLRRLFEITRRRDGQLWSDLTIGLHQKNAGQWTQAAGTFRSVRKRSLDRHEGVVLPGVAARASLQLADVSRLQGDMQSVRQHAGCIPAGAGLASVWAALVRGLAERHPILTLDAELRPQFKQHGCPLGGRVLDRLKVESAANVSINWT